MAISLRLNDEDTNIIRSYAKLKKQSVSEVIRAAIMDQIETEYDLKVYDEAMIEFKNNPITYSQDDVERELGLR
jgi:RHH-type transcriptional regulator, rel operon repressor / antitoxin RelB